VPATQSEGSARRGALLGLGAALSFGVSAPLAKRLLGEVPPVLLAGLLYLGAATGLWLSYALMGKSREPGLGRAQAGRLALIVLAGGVLGPVLMLLGLSRVSALTGSLLLNLEAPLTVLIAVWVCGEHLGKRAGVALVSIVAGAGVLQLDTSGAGQSSLVGAALIALACACWALDNNLTQQLSLRDPFAIVRIKTLVAGLTNSLLGVVLTPLATPSPSFVAGALLLGSLSYGLSVVLDAYALRLIGAAREAAYFATAPFIGACASYWLLGDALDRLDLLALLLMALGVVLLLRERHAHPHVHAALEHEHLHHHDEHHLHEHGPGIAAGEPHSHWHRHGELTHDHPHVPDAHHRHEH
jgi:drug/metabolite transporter (DMT)-like permease